METARAIAAIQGAISMPRDVRLYLLDLVRREQSAAERRQERDRIIRALGGLTGRAEPWAQAGKMLAWFQLWPRHRWHEIRTRGLQHSDTAPFPRFVSDYLLNLYRLTDGNVPTSQRTLHRIITDTDNTD